MKARFLLAAATVALLAGMAVPSVTAQAAPAVGINNPEVSTPTTLYFHMNGFQDFAINTQKPEDKYAEDSNVGLATHSFTCAGNPIPNSSPFQEFHTEYGYSSPSYVEYNFEQNGRPRTHPERGISYDAAIDPAAPFTLYWYLITSPNAGQQGSAPVSPEQAPIPVPNVRVRATMRASDAISVDDNAYNNGPLIAEGITEPATLVAGQVIGPAGPGHPQVTGTQIDGGKYLYEFRVPITVTSPIIPRATGYNVRIDTFMDAQGACGTNASDQPYAMPNLVKVHTSAQYRPRMELSITNPIRLEYLHPQFVGDDLVLHTSMNSAWGNYDVNEVDPDGIQVSITGPSPATSLAKAAMVQRTHEHYFHQEAVDVTYVWPYKTDRAENGLYTVEVKFMNDQRTATAAGVAQFEIGKGLVIGCGGVQKAAQQVTEDCASLVQKDGQAASKDSPGFGVVALLGAVAAAAVVLRRKD